MGGASDSKMRALACFVPGDSVQEFGGDLAAGARDEAHDHLARAYAEKHSDSTRQPDHPRVQK